MVNRLSLEQYQLDPLACHRVVRGFVRVVEGYH